MRVRASDELEPCAGSFAYADRVAGALAEAFGERAESEFTYNWVTAADLLERTACPGRDCAVDPEVFSVEMPREHGLAHAVWAPLSHPSSKRGSPALRRPHNARARRSDRRWARLRRRAGRYVP